MKTLLIGSIATVLVLGGVMWLARPQADAFPQQMSDGDTAILHVASPSYDFGTVSMSRGKVSRDFTVTNTSAASVKLGKLYTSCMCTEAALAVNDRHYGPFGMEGMGYIAPVNALLVPGQSAVVTAIFDPAAHGPAGIGHIERVVTLESDSGAPIVVTFSADVTP